MTPIEHKLSKVKAQLIVEHPFYAALLCNMPLVEDSSIPTLAVDGKNIYYNADYVDTLTINQLKFAQAHEVMHCVMKHLSRRGDRNHRKWNMAGDYIINDMLVTDSVGEIHESWLYDQNIVKAGNYVTDSVYNLLPEDDGGNGSGQGQGGEPQDELREGSEADAKEQEEQWTIRAVQAAQAAKMCGKMSLGAQRLIDQIVKPKMPWQELLRRFVSKQVRTDRSFSRPNRRFLSQGLYLPSLSGESLGHVVVCSDQSGSVSDAENAQYFAELKQIKDELNPSKITVVYFDSRVTRIDEFEQGQDIEYNPVGGGGTAFSPVIDAVNELSEAPDCCVFLTDLYCNDFGQPPEYPVLWVSTGADQAPWGEVCKMN